MAVSPKEISLHFRIVAFAMQLQAADKMGSFMDTALPETAPTPPEPPESGCKVIPFEMVG